jgi:hypothetical protein
VPDRSPQRRSPDSEAADVQPFLIEELLPDLAQKAASHGRRVAEYRRQLRDDPWQPEKRELELEEVGARRGYANAIATLQRIRTDAHDQPSDRQIRRFSTWLYSRYAWNLNKDPRRPYAIHQTIGEIRAYEDILLRLQQVDGDFQEVPDDLIDDIDESIFGHL